MLRMLSLFAVLTLMCLPALAGDEKPKPDAKTERPRIKVFPLQVADPNEARQAFNALMGATSATPLSDTLIGVPKPELATSPASASVECRIIADMRTRSLIVRGTAKEPQFAAEFVAIIDTAEDKPLPGSQALKAFRLKHIEAEEFVSTLRALDPNLNYRLVPVGRMKLLLAVGSDEQMKDFADAVKELDIPAATK